tara:strand:- start:650 stop:847 length:198 start_codon:yes stop_codon:yes gene_type:complete
LVVADQVLLLLVVPVVTSRILTIQLEVILYQLQFKLVLVELVRVVSVEIQHQTAIMDLHHTLEHR